jgi:hypothetical protein
LGKVKWSWFSVHVPDELTSFENKQKTATSRFTKYRNQGEQSDDLTPSQKEIVAATRSGSRTPPAANKYKVVRRTLHIRVFF